MRTSSKISILGKNELVREGLKRILIEDGFEIHATTATYTDLEEPVMADDQCHIILFLVSSGSEAVVGARAMRSRFSTARIVLMADDVSIESVAAAFGEGIDGYVVQSISCEPLKNALRMVSAGEKVFPSQLATALTATAWNLPIGKWDMNGDLNLSGREVEILRCLVSGHSNKVIARQLQITEATVKVHVKAVLRKLRVANRTQAAIWAFTRGLGHDPRPDAEPELSFPPVLAAQAKAQLRVAM